MKKNILANLLGRFWGILSNFLFIPLYIKILGFESYSVISFTLIISGVMLILDGGLTATLSREFARKDNKELEKIKIFKSLEATYLLIASLCIILVFFSANYIAEHWMNLKTFNTAQVSSFLRIFSFEIGFQLLFRFYMGGLLGIEKQVQANVYQIFWGIARNALILLPISIFPDLKVFFIWQMLSTVIFTILIKFYFQKSIGIKFFETSLSIEKNIMMKIGGFAGGMFMIALVSAFNTQLDKIIISKLLSIESLGYYTLAVSISQGLVILINPISTALLPKITAYFSMKEGEKVTFLIQKSSLVISIIIFTFLLTIMVNAKELIWIWTGDFNIARSTGGILPIIALAYALIALQMIPYNIAIANGYTKINNILGIASLFITIPGYIIISKYYGMMGIAIIFCIVQALTLFIYQYFINKKFVGLGYFKDIIFKQFLMPLVVISIFIFLYNLLPNIFTKNRFLSLLWVGFGVFIPLIGTILIFIPKLELLKLLPQKYRNL
ncbi:oligosaccharide flippase family protein [Elizabethkingia anophelis]|uniref:oligosaccharide flippase family protein n=1 Tax=Elizabethkingia anophelis TaxID=1117645 RepID=UPI0021A5C9A9|nr:oligosaccharide flippase family protein [Elizabethkingia anophelis]MCT3977717.1 oligosaccharide flippase family protein [Elizabethkingia anophelis]MCT4041332.1 oligosaccharide flippase family protein [Elizabethkingia anophelis]MCT4174028.1 oligosaccharide flippase family protein [Elizabethkingia anophelis]MCT4177709.1 oligosaccharide flippase family protein [Elizabethkingia anophelis]